MKASKSKFLRWCFVIAGVGLIALTLPRLITGLHARSRQFSVEGAPQKKVAIVFGAGLWRNGRLTPVLRDRVEIAAALYFEGKVDLLLMSGENQGARYDEPGSMRDYALSLGVPKSAIWVDGAGLRTYDTCYRARNVFQIDKAILVTQGYHLPRALYTCNKLGLSAVGVSADLRNYRQRWHTFWNLRELPATIVALWDIHVSTPL